MESRTWRYWGTVLLWMGLGLVAYVFWKWLVGYLLPFVLAALIAGLLEPLADHLVGRGWPRTPAVVVSLVLGVGSVLTIILALLSLLTVELLRLLHSLPEYVSRWQAFVNQNLSRLGALRTSLGITQTDLHREMGSLYQMVESALRAILFTALALPDNLLVMVMALVAAFFLMRDRAAVHGGLRGLLPPGLRMRASTLSSDIVAGTLGFVKAQLLLVTTTAVTTTAGLTLLGQHYAVLVGLASGVLDLIPFLGPTVLLLPWAGALLAQGRPVDGLELLAVLTAVGVIRQLLEPRLVGSQTGLHPLVVLFSLYLGIRLFGGVGFIAGPISAIVLRAVGQTMTGAPNQPPGRIA
ncbi:MAG: sporulation integral membrane protein YtvI [Thermaerobacter sp.]|nr:sporulation integral membrane protein YtvI [Thermaerobacter sp.]